MIIDESSYVRTKHGTVDVMNLVGDLRVTYRSATLLTREEMKADIFAQKAAILTKLREVKPVPDNVLEGLTYQVHEVRYFTARDSRDLRGQVAGVYASMDHI